MSGSRKSIFSFAENILDYGKKIIEEHISEINEESSEPSKPTGISPPEILYPSSQMPKHQSYSESTLNDIQPISPQILENKSLNNTPYNFSTQNDYQIYDALKTAQSVLSSVEMYINEIPEFLNYLKSNKIIRKNEHIITNLTIRALINELFAQSQSRTIESTILFNLHSNPKTSKFINEIAELKNQASVNKKHISKLNESLNKILQENKNLEIKNSNNDVKYNEIINVVNKQKNQIDQITREMTETNSSLINSTKIINSKDAEILTLNQKITDLQKMIETNTNKVDSDEHLVRLKNHLIDVEQQYTNKIEILENNKITLENQIQNISLDLNRTKITLQEAKNNYDRHSKILSEQLLKLNEERDKLVSEIIVLTNTIDNQRNNIESLEYNISELELNYKSQIESLIETNEIECHKIVNALKMEHDENINKCKSEMSLFYEPIIQDLRLKNEADKNEYYSVTNEISVVEDNKKDDLEKELLKNLVIAYQKVSLEHKVFVWRVICNILDVEPVDNNPPSITRQTLSWIPGFNRLFDDSTSDAAANGPSLSELFVDFLETESKKNTSSDIPPISKEDLKNLISRHQSNS